MISYKIKKKNPDNNINVHKIYRIVILYQNTFSHPFFSLHIMPNNFVAIKSQGTKYTKKKTLYFLQ